MNGRVVWRLTDCWSASDPCVGVNTRSAPWTTLLILVREGGDDTLMPSGRDFIVAARHAAQETGIQLFDIADADQGIVHVISPELGIALPGLSLICPDSHTCTLGGLGALAWGGFD